MREFSRAPFYLFLLTLTVLAFNSRGASAADGTSTIKVEETKEKVEKPELQPAPEKKLTDLELRAQAGSKSLLSAKFNLTYSGPPVDNLSDAYRPNPDTNRAGDMRTNISGSFGLRARLASDKALGLSAGMKWFTPYQAIIGEEVDRPRGSKNMDVNDPELNFDKTSVLGPVQMRSSVSGAAVTNDYYSKRGQWGTFTVGQSMKYTPMMGRWVLGFQVLGSYFSFRRPYLSRTEFDKKRGDGSVSRYKFDFIPSVEYKLSDNLNFNTSYIQTFQNLRRVESKTAINRLMPGWRVGFGWAATQVVYLNPYINLYPTALTWETASLGLTSIFSVF